MTAIDEARSPWAEELDGVVRAMSAGMLFGIPLLYTMEVWWVGSVTGPVRMLVVLAATFVLLVLLNHTAGFRDSKDVRIADALRDSVEGLAISLVSVFVVLVILREIDAGTALGEGLGKVVYQSTPFAFGVGLARHFLRKGRTQGDDEEGDDGGATFNETAVDVGATMLGAVFVAFNIAPTDEIPMISAAISPIWLVVLIAATLAISYCIVFEAGFANEEKRRQHPGVFQDPLTETLWCYLLALVASFAMLVFFRRIELTEPFFDILGRVVVLGLPAAIGGAAGRLAA